MNLKKSMQFACVIGCISAAEQFGCGSFIEVFDSKTLRVVIRSNLTIPNCKQENRSRPGHTLLIEGSMSRIIAR